MTDILLKPLRAKTTEKELNRYKIAVLECFIAVCQSNNYTPAENQIYLVLGDLLCMDSSPRAIRLLKELEKT